MVPSWPTTRMASGLAMTTSKSMVPPLMLSARSSKPTTSAPASLAFSALAPWANTATRTVLPVPCGSVVAPRTFWSDLRASTPRLMATSMDSANLGLANSPSSATASSTLYALPESTFSAISFVFLVNLAIIRLPRFRYLHYERCLRWCEQRRRDRPRSGQALSLLQSLPAVHGSACLPFRYSGARNHSVHQWLSSAAHWQEESW